MSRYSNHIPAFDSLVSIPPVEEILSFFRSFVLSR
jgi:hypothetical protein